MRDNDYRRPQNSRDFDDERQGRDADRWGGQRQQGGYQGRDQGGYGQASQSEYNQWGGQGRFNEYGSDQGASRAGGPGSSEYGGYGDGNRYQEDRSGYGRQQEQFSQGVGQQGYNDRFSGGQGGSGGYGGRQYGGESYGRGQEGYGHDSQRDAYRSAGGQTHHDPDYHQWRGEQLRNLDKDYDDWRNQRYQKFSEDFNTYRAKRSSENAEGAKQQPGSTSGKTKDQS